MMRRKQSRVLLVGFQRQWLPWFLIPACLLGVILSFAAWKAASPDMYPLQLEARASLMIGPNSEAPTDVIAELYATVTPQRLKQIAKAHKARYANGKPFPHIAIDGIFPDGILQAVLHETRESLLGADGCMASKCFKGIKQKRKSAIMDENEMGLYTRVLFAFLKSSPFVEFLQELTGINNIIPDPHYKGSGLHFTSRGGRLDIHADFNRYKEFELDRRVNTFIFLNPDWPEEYGGHLELWSKDAKTCSERILPTLGRFVVFSSTDFSYHGHPEELPAPEDRVRRSMALYYYTNGRPSDECVGGECSGEFHNTRFPDRACEKCEEPACYRFNPSIPNFVLASP